MRTRWNRRRIRSVHDAAGDGGCRLGAVGAARLGRGHAHRGQLDPLADQSLPRHLEQGRRRLRQVGRRRLCDAGDRGQQREGRRRHQGDPGQDRRQHASSTSTRTTARTRGRSSRPARGAGAYVVTQWNKPADLHPWDHDPNYVAHISFNGVPNGKAMAEALIKAMGGKGGIVALGGILSNVPGDRAQEGPRRGAGRQPRRQAARLPGRQLVGHRGAREDQRLAHPVRRSRSAASGRPTTTWRSPRVEALRADGRAGKVPVTGIDGIQLAVEAILNGEMAGTVAWDPYLAGRHGPLDRLPRQDRQVRSRRRSRRTIASSTARA